MSCAFHVHPTYLHFVHTRVSAPRLIYGTVYYKSQNEYFKTDDVTRIKGGMGGGGGGEEKEIMLLNVHGGE